ncbi:MAG TPA: nickel pincer cofactor biosynthesis protein LarC [Caldilineaceae bacterium]|nr:nickel pincer cofactor biosynthesis protein LarC [Caldilineaceae bacterium]
MIAYLDLPSGISGDMFLGCLVDGGWPVAALQETIAQLQLPAGSWQITEQAVMRGPLRATLVDVQATVGDAHRHLADIRQMIEASALRDAVKVRALAVFTRLAQAEAAVHGSTVEEVHFHEVGALDAIIDIVGVCAGLEALGVVQLYASGAPLGEGWTPAAHGRIPLPAPATLALLTAVNAPTRPAPGPGELVTPTGAALLAELAIFRQPRMQLQCIGLGAGQKDFAWPNIARLWLGEPLDGGQLVELSANIDDMNPEFYEAVRTRLFAAGALDVWTTPIGMKKGRPGILFSVLAPADKESILADLMLRETTTLGVRVHQVHRHEAPRDFIQVETPYGTVSVKRKWVYNELVGAKPEYDDCVRLAEQHHVAVRTVYEAALIAAHGASQRQSDMGGAL